MYAFFPSSTSGPVPAVVALPGGGYSHLAVAHEGTDWAHTSRRMVWPTLHLSTVCPMATAVGQSQMLRQR